MMYFASPLPLSKGEGCIKQPPFFNQASKIHSFGDDFGEATLKIDLE
ncbi:hypothetical protein [Mucilaginibacter ginsenosidivorans]|nr:hypothetical protein [Mucilaginibacter ginsenosidivorans]